MQQGKLMLSSNRGRYEVCTTGSVPFDDEIYPELTSGDVVEVKLGGHWIKGSIEHAPVYAIEQVPGRAVGGYFFIANDGGVCGLCETMEVRIS